MNTLDTSLGELAREIPGATALFYRHKLDFCCGGQQSLRDAAARKSLDAQALAQALESLKADPVEQSQLSALPDERLIEHILSRYHDRHREQLPELIRLAARVELVHGGHPECPAGLADHLDEMLAELESHMQKEEQILFPMILRGMHGFAKAPVSMMRHEHDHHGQALARIHRFTRQLTLPEGACNTWRALYVGLEALERDLMEHIHLENNLLFERIDGEGH
jgi:regulator of cell morphogenesis and NO signaling